jgi:hypothetical protein
MDEFKNNRESKLGELKVWEGDSNEFTPGMCMAQILRCQADIAKKKAELNKQTSAFKTLQREGQTAELELRESSPYWVLLKLCVALT